MAVQHTQSQSLRIIVADDDADMRAYYERTLQLLGHEVVLSASNGRELADWSREQMPDLVITDVQMPGLNGLEAIDRIAEHVPCIIVSAYDRPNDWAEHNSGRLISYLIKPIRLRDLEAAVASAVSRLADKDC